QLGTRQAEQQREWVARPTYEVLEQIETRRLGPVHGLDHHDERLVTSGLLEQPPHGPEHLAASGRRAGRADRAEHSLCHELAVLDPGQQFTNALVAAERADDLYERPEGDAVAVRETAARECLGLTAHLAAQLGA